MTTNAQPFSYHLSNNRSPVTSLNRNLAKSSTDIRSTRSSSNPRYQERRNSLERTERIKSPIHIPISTYKTSPSQRAYFESNNNSPFSPIDNYEFNSEPLLDSPLLSTNTASQQKQLTTIDNLNKPQRFRTRIISTETTTETTSSTTVKRPQETILANLNNNANQSTGTIRYHNIDLDPIDRHN